MPPQQPTYYGPQAPPPGPGQYDFIMSGNHKPPRSPLTGASTKMRIIVFGGGALFLIIIIWVVISALSSGGTSNVKQLEDIAQQQSEIARISQTPTTQAVAPATQNFAATTQLSLMSEQNAFIAFLGKNGVKLDSKSLVNPNAKTDATLKTAQTNGNYDQTYTSIAQAEITAYQNSLQQAYASAKSPSEKQLLSSAYNGSQLLLAQSKQH